MKERLVWADLLRITACIMVIGIHSSGTYYYIYDRLSICWWVSVIINSFGHFAVPCFFMLSGMFMLNPQRNISLGSIYKHSIPKLVELLIFSIFVSLGVSFVYFIFGKEYVYGNEAPIHTIFQIMVLYAITPGLRILVNYKNDFLYTVILLLVLDIFVAPLTNLPMINHLSTEILEANKLLVSLTFYLLGYFIYSSEKKIRLPFLLAGFITGYIIHFYCLYIGLDKKGFYLNIALKQVVQIDTLLISVTTFILFKQINVIFSKNLKKVLGILGKASMFIYVTHYGILRLLIGAKILINNPFQVPIDIIINFIVCTIIAICYMLLKGFIVNIINHSIDFIKRGKENVSRI